MTRAITPACPPRLAQEFVGPPTHVSLVPGERLYKFINIPIDRPAIMRSPWWIREREFDRLRHLSVAQGRSLSDVVRERLAVASRWNPGMDGLCIVHLARQKPAWIGPAKSQLTFKENLVGWGEQACVPDLEWRDVAQTRMQVPFFQSGQHPLHPLP
jgi:hypothetical protein